MIDFYSAQLIARKIMDHTGMTPDEVLKLDTSEYARLSGRSTPVQAALRAIDAQVTQPLNPGPEAVAPPLRADDMPQGIDVNSDEYFLHWRAQRTRGGERRRHILGHGRRTSVTKRWESSLSLAAGSLARRGSPTSRSPTRSGRAYLR
jgi:hypothetical protein